MKTLRILLFLLGSLIIVSCSKAKEEQLWQEATTKHKAIMKDMNQADEISKTLIEKIRNTSTPPPQKEAYLILLQGLKKAQNDLLEWEQNFTPLDSLQQHNDHKKILDYLHIEVERIDSLSENMKDAIQHCSGIAEQKH